MLDFVGLWTVRVKVEEVPCIVNPNSLAPFFVSSLSPRKGRGQKMGVPPGFRTGDPRTTMHCSPMARHPGVAARAAISFPYETHFYDVIGLSTFSSLPLVGFCWTVDG